MAENEAPVVFDSNTDTGVPGTAVLTSTDFTPVDAGSDVTITYADNDATMTSVDAAEVQPAGQPVEESGFSASVRRGVSFLKSFVPTDVNQRFDTFRSEQSNSMKPWKTFIGGPDYASSFGFVNPKYVPSRFMSNLKSYLWNYVALFGITFAIISLFNFPFFLVALALIAIWMYIFFWRSGPMVMFGQTLPHKMIVIGLGIVSVAVCWLVLGNEFWIAVLCNVAICAIHALIRKADNETVDFH